MNSEKLIEVAKRELGNHPYERPSGSNCTKYGVWYNYNCVPWCGQFVSFVVIEKCELHMPKFMYTPTGASWFAAQGQWFEEGPKPGDLAFFDFPDSLARIQHVGFVIRRIGVDMVETIEGNTASNSGGSQDDGGGVYIRQRPMSYIVGFGRLPELGKPDEPRFKFKKRDWFGAGDKGADVKLWQVQLNRWSKNLPDRKADFEFTLDVDGKFGNDTLKATKTFQTFYKLDVDGRVGQATRKKMSNVRERQKERKADDE